MATMLAARYLGTNQIETREVLLPSIQPGEALIRVEACGFCGSDISIISGTHPRAQAPLTIGHELSGRIVEIAGDHHGLTCGQRVTTYPLISCGTCYACTHGNPHVCRSLRLFGFDVDGGMAEFVKLPTASLLPLPDDMSADIGSLIEPLAVAVHGVRRARMDEDTRITVVLGAGPIGILTALFAKSEGVRDVIISDPLSARLELAESIGLTAISSGAAIHEHIMQISSGDGADVVFECAGHPSSAKEMTTLVRARGTIVNLGVFKKPVEVDLQSINFKEIEVVGSRVYERLDFQTAIDIAMSLPIEPIISRRFPLRDVSNAFSLFRAGEVCKVLILPSLEVG